MRRNRESVPWLCLSIVAVWAVAMFGGCSGATSQDATSTVSQALEAASNSSDAPEAANLMRGPEELRPEAVEGFHCDASPDITFTQVCGKNLPATVHLEWTSCAPPQRPGGMGDGCMGGHGGPPPGFDGGAMPPPPFGGPPPDADGGFQGPPGPFGALAGFGGGHHGHGGPGQGGDFAGPSSGTVDITFTYSTPDGCGGAIVQDQSAAFNITRTREDGTSSNATGTSTSSATLAGFGPPAEKSTQLDVVRTQTDAAGVVSRSVHVTGSMSVAFSNAIPPVRTVNGSYTEDSSVDGQATVTMTDIVRPPRNVCPWPTSGTLSRVSDDGETHTLVYGPDCGAATLDGSAVTLPDQGRGGGR